MAHQMYHTDALVLASYPRGEANSVIALFTRELGLVRVFARSVLKETGKLRYSLRPLTFSKVTLIRGKEYWRIIGALPLDQLAGVGNDYLKKQIVARSARLLNQYVQGEESHPELFDDIRAGFTFLDDGFHSEDEMKTFEIGLAVRMLNHLGYVESREFAHVVEPTLWSRELLSGVSDHVQTIEGAIANALLESQL